MKEEARWGNNVEMDCYSVGPTMSNHASVAVVVARYEAYTNSCYRWAFVFDPVPSSFPSWSLLALLQMCLVRRVASLCLVSSPCKPGKLHLVSSTVSSIVN